jgi:hypothetical protein
MAGLGRKVFTAGEVLAAADVNGFLADQVVMVFDDAAARSSAIPTPTEGMMTYTKDDNAVQVFDGSSFTAVDTTISTLAGSAITGDITVATINSTNVTHTLTASTATAYEVAAADQGTLIQFTAATAVVTVGTATGFTSGQRVDILADSEDFQLTAGTGVTLSGAGTAGTALTFTTGAQYEVVTIVGLGSDAYRVIGNISVV